MSPHNSQGLLFNVCLWPVGQGPPLVFVCKTTFGMWTTNGLNTWVTQLALGEIMDQKIACDIMSQSKTWCCRGGRKQCDIIYIFLKGRYYSFGSGLWKTGIWTDCSRGILEAKDGIALTEKRFLELQRGGENVLKGLIMHDNIQYLYRSVSGLIVPQ